MRYLGPDRHASVGVVPPAVAAAHELEPLCWLIEIARDFGLWRDDDSMSRLDAEGRQRFGLRGNLGDDPIGVLISVLTDIGALRGDERLYPTELGLMVARDKRALWHAVIPSVFGPDSFHIAVIDLGFAILRAGPERERPLAKSIHPGITPYFRSSNTGRPTPLREVKLALIRIAWVAEPLGMLKIEGEMPVPGRDRTRWPNRIFTVTGFGIASANEALRLRRVGAGRYADDG